jgi:hypothetical protein
MNELKKIKDLFDDFIKEADKIMKKQRIKQTITSEKTIYWGETAEEDMPWEDSRDWCEEKGGRLPTLKELKKAYKDGVSGFISNNSYWFRKFYFLFCFFKYLT